MRKKCSLVQNVCRKRRKDLSVRSPRCLEKQDRLNGEKGVTAGLLNACRHDQLMGRIVSLIVGSFVVKRGITLSPAIPMTLHQRYRKPRCGSRRNATAKGNCLKWRRGKISRVRFAICAQFNRTIQLRYTRRSIGRGRCDLCLAVIRRK